MLKPLFENPHWFVLSSIILLAEISGCVGGPPQVSTQHVDLGEAGSYDYSLFGAAKQSPSQRRPLLVLFHPRGGNAQNMIRLWQEEAESGQWVLIAIDYDRLNFNHKKALAAIYRKISELDRAYAIDRKRIYALGVSAGALVARWLVVQDIPCWAGVISIATPDVAGWLPYAANFQGKPIFLFVHGAHDEQFPANIVTETVAALKMQNVQVDLIIDPSARHADYQASWNQQIVNWIKARESSV